MNGRKGKASIVLIIFIILLMQLLLISISLYKNNLIINRVKDVVYYSLQNIITEFNMDELSYSEYSYDKDKVIEKITNVIYKNINKYESSLIKIENIDYINNDVTIKYSLELKFINKKINKTVLERYKVKLMEI